MEVRKGISAVRRQIRNLQKHEKEFLKKAVRAKQLGDRTQYAFIKNVLRRTAGQRRVMERQLLAIETAAQIKNQAEIHAQFARSMSAISRAIAAAFGETDLERTQAEFEKALQQASSMEQRMELFLEASQDSITAQADYSGEEVVSDDEIEQMVEDELAHAEGADLDREISKGLAEIERELQKDGNDEDK